MTDVADIDYFSEVHQLDPSLAEDEESFLAAVALLASVEVGPNQVRIAKRTGIPRWRIGYWGREWRRNGVWQGHNVAGAEWFDPESGAIAFWCDVAVGLGMLEKA